MMRRIVCKNVNNMRDLGGYLTKEGFVTKFNRFIRSNLPIDLEDEEIDYLKQIGITTIIDLRTEREVNRVKCYLNNGEFDYYNINVNGDNCLIDENNPVASYMMLLNNKERLLRVFKIIANSSGGVLFHCTAGKDRTGIIAMLLLLIANVYEDDIIADYQVTYTYLRKNVRQMHIDDPNLSAYVGLSNMETMEEVLRLFHEKYGNVYNYFMKVGITEDEFYKIQDKLLK